MFQSADYHIYQAENLQVSRVSTGSASAVAVQMDTTCVMAFSLTHHEIFSIFFPNNQAVITESWRFKVTSYIVIVIAKQSLAERCIIMETRRDFR